MYEFPVHGQINIYRFVPLDETYTNTLHFKTREEQLTYFGCSDHNTPYSGGSAGATATSVLKLTYTNQTYTRNERQYIRIEANANMLYDCNYMAYQNRDFGGMWFFAFIHAVEYINDYVAEVEFELDVMQTFMWNFEMRDCFVIREHSKTDKIGDSLTPEPVQQMPYKTAKIEKTGWFDKYSILLFTTYEQNPLGAVNRPTYNKIGNLTFSGSVSTFDSDDTDGLREWLDVLASAGGLDGILTAIYFPTHFATTSHEIAVEYKQILPPTDIQGYVPKNNKLFTYPYSFLEVDCSNTNAVYRYEFFQAQAATFRVDAVEGLQPQIRLTPQWYNIGDTDTSTFGSTDFTEGIIMDNFPAVQLSGEDFANWFAVNGFSVATNLAIDIGQIAYGLGSGWGGGVVRGTSGLAQDISTVVTQNNTPISPRSSGRTVVDVACKLRDFYFKTKQVCREGAEMYDRFFSMYGYAVNRVKRPNMWSYDNCRKKWNYIKATNCNFHWHLYVSEGKGTSVPQKYMKKIYSIFENGITFWKDPLGVGKYTDDNDNLLDNPT